MSQHSTEDRLSLLESKVAALELAEQEDDSHDIALLARVDGAVGDLRRIERTQMRSFEELRTGQEALRNEMHAGQEELRAEMHTGQEHLIAFIRAGQEYSNDRMSNIENDVKENTLAIEKLQDGQEKLHTDLNAKHEYTQLRLDTIEDEQTKLIEFAVEHQEAIGNLVNRMQALEAGQQQILDILTGGKPKMND